MSHDEEANNEETTSTGSTSGGALEIDIQTEEVIRLCKDQLPDAVHPRLDDKFVLRFLRGEKYNSEKASVYYYFE